MEKRELHSVLTDFLNERLIQVTASGQAEKNDFLKAKIRPVLAKGALHFQAEEFIGKQAFHKNLTAEEAVDYLEGLMETSFRQLQLEAQDKSGTVLVSKKGKTVPCCQHEVNKQMESELFAPVFHYGIIKERMAALYTDALRAEVLEAMGYRVQILEFIDMEHTPKNLLIRAVKQGKRKENREVIEAILREIHAEPTLYRLLMEEK